MAYGFYEDEFDEPEMDLDIDYDPLDEVERTVEFDEDDEYYDDDECDDWEDQGDWDEEDSW